jgi:alpha-tubulin suppressor-like RCC1 family protein
MVSGGAADGMVILTATITDAATNSAADTRVFLKDFTPPMLAPPRIGDVPLSLAQVPFLNVLPAIGDTLEAAIEDVDSSSEVSGFALLNMVSAGLYRRPNATPNLTPGHHYYMIVRECDPAGNCAAVNTGNWTAVTANNQYAVWGRGPTELGVGPIGFLQTLNFPMNVQMPGAVTKISSGYNNTCAITTAGVTFCWGQNSSYQVGDGTGTDRDVPTPLSSLPAVTDISMGFRHGCAVATSGKVYCWGSQTNGEIGDNASLTATHATPVMVTGSTPFNSSVFQSVNASMDHTCALSIAGVVWCWGNNPAGQLGPSGPSQTFSPVTVGSGYVKIAAGESFNCGIIGATNVIKCWGSGSFGKLGDNVGSDRATPAPLFGALQFVDVSAGQHHACGVEKTTGKIYCWGNGGNGRLGSGSLADSPVPVLATAAGAFFTQVSASVGGAHTCARTLAGFVYCWGANSMYQIGDGGGLDALTPEKISEKHFTSVSTGGTFSFAIPQ